MSRKIRKICLNCKYARIQITECGTDLDFNKPLVCINTKEKDITQSFMVDEDNENVLVQGFEVEDYHSCNNFTINKARKKDIECGC